jgi:hypothetical protein
MSIPKDFDSGTKLENRVKEILVENSINFKEQPLLTYFNLRADYLVLEGTKPIVVEVSQRNKNPDIQRLCFRSLAYKNSLEIPVEVLVVIKNLNTKPQSLRLYMLLLKFTDYFLFSDDLKYLPRIIRGEIKLFLNI